MKISLGFIFGQLIAWPILVALMPFSSLAQQGKKVDDGGTWSSESRANNPFIRLEGFELASQYRVYSDGETTVKSPALDISKTFNGDRSKLAASYAQDVLQSASADVKSYASKGEIDDNRKEFGLSAETQITDGTMSVGYIQSDEDDYNSRIVSAGGTREFFQKNTTVSYSFSGGYDTIRSAGDSNFAERMRHQIYSFSLSQILSQTSLIQLIADLRVENGFIASPYRRARIVTTSGATETVVTSPETHPETRNRNALAVKYNRFFRDWRLATASTYRFYFDSWAVQSHTLEVRLSREWTTRFATSLSARAYTQKGASFFQDYYRDGDGSVFRTGNSTLSDLSSVTLGVRPTYTFSEGTLVYAKLEWYQQRSKNATEPGVVADRSDDAPQGVTATIIGAGLSVRF
jgi:hypothetical protein